MGWHGHLHLQYTRDGERTVALDRREGIADPAIRKPASDAGSTFIWALIIFLAGFAVEDAVGVGGVLEHEGDVEDAHQRDQAGKVAGAGDDDVDGAAAYAADGGLEGAQRAVGEDFEVECATGLGFEQFAELFSGLELGIRTRGFGGESQGFGLGRSDHAGQGAGQQQGLEHASHALSAFQRLKISEVFTPPKAKLLFITYWWLIWRNSPRR